MSKFTDSVVAGMFLSVLVDNVKAISTGELPASSPVLTIQRHEVMSVVRKEGKRPLFFIGPFVFNDLELDTQGSECVNSKKLNKLLAALMPDALVRLKTALDKVEARASLESKIKQMREEFDEKIATLREERDATEKTMRQEFKNNGSLVVVESDDDDDGEIDGEDLTSDTQETTETQTPKEETKKPKKQKAA